MSQIFVSYAQLDRDFAAHLFRRLNEVGINSLADGDLVRGGREWSDAVDRAIEEALALVVIMTPEAKNTEYVTYEWTLALSLKKTVIPVLLEPTRLHPRLNSLQALDFTDEADPWGELVERLRQVERAYSTNRLVEALRDENWETRMVAAEILGQKGDPALIRPLAASLYDDYVEVRIAAAKALSEIPHPDGVPYLVKSLHENELGVRVWSAWALGKIGHADAVPGLVKALRDDNTAVRWNAAWALGEIGADAVPGLVKALRDRDGRVRGTAAGALAAIGVSDAVPGLVIALRDPSWTVREAAARALGQLKDAAAVHGLIEALRDTDDRVRSTASSALAAIGEAAVSALSHALHDDEAGVRLAAVGALGVITYKKRIPGLLDALTKALEDEDNGVRAVVVWALGEMQDSTTLPILITVMRNDLRGNVRAAAVKALLRIGTPEARQAIEAWQQE
jgi:HEAT repeat protein